MDSAAALVECVESIRKLAEKGKKPSRDLVREWKRNYSLLSAAQWELEQVVGDGN